MNAICEHEKCGINDVYVFHIPGSNVFSSCVMEGTQILTGNEIPTSCYDVINVLGNRILFNQKCEKIVNGLTERQRELLRQRLNYLAQGIDKS